MSGEGELRVEDARLFGPVANCLQIPGFPDGR